MLLGHFTYGICQWLMLIVVARLGLPEMVGRFALAMAITTPIILLIGLDLRTVQATDQSNLYSFEDFLILRIGTLALAMAVIMGVTALSGHTWELSLLIFVMGITKCIEALSDLCYGTLQQYEQLHLMAISRILRGVMSVAVLAGGLYLTHSLMLATVSLAVMWTGVLIAFDWPAASRLRHRHGISTSGWKFNVNQLWPLLMAAIPSGILSCQASLEQNLPRLCIDGYLGDRELGIYSAVSSLVIAGAMVINAVHCAVLPRIARYLVTDQWRESWRMMLKLSLCGAIAGLLGTAAVHVCGGWILGLAFGPEYAAHSPLLVVLMLGATIRYATLPLSTGIRAARRFWLLSVLQTLALIAAVPVLMLLIKTHRGMGAAYGSVVLSLLNGLILIPAALLLLRPQPQTRRSDSVDVDSPFAAEIRGAA
jgi:O-antigen/teichoic acid export membrane protein